MSSVSLRAESKRRILHLHFPSQTESEYFTGPASMAKVKERKQGGDGGDEGRAGAAGPA